MTKRIYAALVSLVAAAAALSLAGPADAAARCDGHHCQHHAARRTRQRERGARQRARRRDKRRAVAYVCPMHADIRERSRGTCPKCLMDLVAEPRGAKAGGARVNARDAGASASGGM
jgi:Heavy metal binding domain